MKLTYWLCKKCKKPKKLGTEIARADMNAICKECQAGLNGDAPETDAASPEQQVYVHRRGFVRRHGKDNRDFGQD